MKISTNQPPLVSIFKKHCYLHTLLGNFFVSLEHLNLVSNQWKNFELKMTLNK